MPLKRKSLLITSQSLEKGWSFKQYCNSKLVKWKSFVPKRSFLGGDGAGQETASQMSSLLILDKLAKMSPNPQKVLSHVDHLLK